MDLCNEKDCKYYDKKYECNCCLGDSTETFETCQNNNLRFKSPQNLAKADAYSLLGDVRAVLKELNSIGPRINAHWCFGECSAGEEFCPREYCLDEKISELYKKVSEHCI